ncbi:MAG: flagellar hook capping protein [Lachnospiraceae bacterium]|nr:flagellar hook capping protein [Lachnospiraceae bacterium]
MSLVAPVEKGQLTINGVSAADREKAKATSTESNSMDKDSFLQLLVAQMKYQDPLEPTSNTEYISQYAQFSQVESLQNMSLNMDLQRASSLVGQMVYVKTTDESGATDYVYGKVDYVTYQGNKPYLYINEKSYPLEDLETIVEPEYYEAYNLATKLVTGINRLPKLGLVDLSYADKIDELNEIYNNMTDYQKTFVAKEKVEALEKYVAKIDELRKLADEANKGPDEVEKPDETEGTESEDA